LVRAGLSVRATLCLLLTAIIGPVYQALASTTQAQTQDVRTAGAVARLDDLQPGWNTIVAGGETSCSDGSPYRFLARPADPARLVVYFEGGGACFDGRTCDPHLDPTYTVNLSSLNPRRFNGIFAFDHPENPFAGRSVVVVPYCTGDVHLGDREAVYDAPATRGHAPHPVTIRHRGAVNAKAALDWVQSRFVRPETIFVAGSSGGAIPSPYYTHHLAVRYPNARIAQLGDGAGGYRGAAETGLHDTWGLLGVVGDLDEFSTMAPREFSFEKLYVATARRHPRITFAEYDTAEDTIQLRFLRLAGVRAPSLLPLLKANYADIRGEVGNFRSFVAGGDLHTILARPEFYTYRVNGTRVRDWVALLAAGQPVSDVLCTDCAAPDTPGGPPPAP
jgi:hypothetical protein